MTLNCRGAAATPPPPPPPLPTPDPVLQKLSGRPLTAAAASCITRRSPADRCRSSIPITSYSCGTFDTRAEFERTWAPSAAVSPWKKSHLSPQRVPGEFPHFNTLNGAQQPGQGASYYIGDPFTPDKTRQFVAATFAQPAFPLTFHYHLLFFSSSLVKIEFFFVFFAFCLCLKPFSSCLRELMTIFLRLELKKFFFFLHLIKMPANYFNHRPQMLNYIGQSLLKCVFL